MKRSELFLSVGLVVNVVLFFMVGDVYGMRASVLKDKNVNALQKQKMPEFIYLVRSGKLDSKQELSHVIQQFKDHENKIAEERKDSFQLIKEKNEFTDCTWDSIAYDVEECKKFLKNAMLSVPDSTHDETVFGIHKKIMGPWLQNNGFDINKIDFRLKDQDVVHSPYYYYPRFNTNCEDGTMCLYDIESTLIDVSPLISDTFSLAQKAELIMLAWSLMHQWEEEKDLIAISIAYLENPFLGNLFKKVWEIKKSDGFTSLIKTELKASRVGPALTCDETAELMCCLAEEMKDENYEIFFDINMLWKKFKFLKDFTTAKIDLKFAYYKNRLVQKKQEALACIQCEQVIDNDLWEQVMLLVESAKKGLREAAQSAPDTVDERIPVAIREFMNEWLQKHTIAPNSVCLELNTNESCDDSVSYSADSVVHVFWKPSNNFNAHDMLLFRAEVPKIIFPLSYFLSQSTQDQKAMLLRLLWGIIAQQGEERAILGAFIKHITHKEEELIDNGIGIYKLCKAQKKETWIYPAVSSHEAAKLMATRLLHMVNFNQKCHSCTTAEKKLYNELNEINNLWDERQFVEEISKGKMH